MPTDKDLDRVDREILRLLSADATPSQIERLLTAGARNYLTKPFDIDPFLAVVDEMVA